MSEYASEELQSILESHKKWTYGAVGGEKADLRNADLRNADLLGAKSAKLVQAQTIIVPEGSIVGWKKCENCRIVKLRIPEEAKRSNATGRKCRAEYAEVMEVQDFHGNVLDEAAVSTYDDSVKYEAGTTVRADTWDSDRFNECSNGIHFFITREEAMAYQ